MLFMKVFTKYKIMTHLLYVLIYLNLISLYFYIKNVYMIFIIKLYTIFYFKFNKISITPTIMTYSYYHDSLVLYLSHKKSINYM